MSNRSTTAGMIVAALAFLVEGVAVIGHQVPDHHWGTRGAVVDLAGAVGFLASAASLSSFVGSIDRSRVGLIAVRVAQAGLSAMTVESIASLIHGGNTLGPVFVVGLMLSLVGLLVTAVVGLRVEAIRWISPLPFLGLFVSIAAGDQGGAIAFAVVWLAIAVLIGRDRVPAAA